MIFYHCTKFGAKILIDAKIMAQNKIQNGDRCHLLFISGSYFQHTSYYGLQISTYVQNFMPISQFTTEL